MAKSRIVAVVELTESDPNGPAALIDVEKLPRNSEYRQAIIEALENDGSGTIASDYSRAYGDSSEEINEAVIETPFTGTIEGSVALFVEETELGDDEDEEDFDPDENESEDEDE